MDGAAPSFSPLPDGTEWLRYGNEGATRNLPLSDDLVSALSFLPELGVEMEVFSGGQPGEGEGPRVGSTRHDHGNAADVFFSQNGRRLDWSNPDDLPIFEEIVRRGKAAGITGFGAGDGYMQPGSMHIGFGNPGVWGAGGSGANAPDWLRNAYDGSEASPMATQGQGTGELPLETLFSAVSNPFLMADPGMASVVNSMLAQRMQQMDPMHALDMDYKRAQIAKMEADASAGPKAATSFGTPIWGSDPEGNAVFGTLDNAGNFNITETPEGFSFGKEPIRLDTGNEFTLLDPVTRQVIGTVPKDNYGSAYETAAGSAAGKAGVEAQLGAQEAIATAQRTLTQIENLKNDPGLWWSVGGLGWTPNVPGNPQAGTISRIEQLQGASFLQAFESLKGGGQITEVEGTKATNAIARLQRSQSYEEFIQALTELQEVVQAGLERAQRQAQGEPMPLPNVAGGNAGSPGNGGGWEVVGVE
ncbi:hypothetical protein A3840_08605 [Devosia elaeis]|uniref:Uncharacterized protein n=2 Tax=Devosia elaeis TaxID=1770058 RepID=A0A178I0K3_9HYPH|nr:hypothetical protein A3840_08605 [Devosia elaeis]